MTQTELLADLSGYVIVAAFTGSLTFLAVYAALAKGWRSEIGRALLMLDTGLAMLTAPSALHYLAGLTESGLWVAWYAIISVALVAAATWWRAWFVVKVQWRGRKHRAPEGDR